MAVHREPAFHCQVERIGKLSRLIKPIASSDGGPWEGLAVELFRIQGPFSISVSVADFYLGLVREGTGTAWLSGSGGQCLFTAGHVAVFPPGEEHGASSRGMVGVTSIYLSRSLMERAAPETTAAAIEVRPQLALVDPILRRLALALEAELRSGLPPNRLFGETVGTALAVHILTHYKAKPISEHAYRGGMPKHLLRRTLDYIKGNLGADLRLSELAENIEMSSWHFCRTFKQSMGVTPHKYLMRERIEAAKRLLVRPDRNVETIAIELGFADQSHLITLFRRYTGYTPKQFITTL